MPRQAAANHILRFEYLGHPNQHDKKREWNIPEDCPRDEIAALGKRLSQCTEDQRGARIWGHYAHKHGLFQTVWVGNYSRDTLLKLQSHLNRNFTSKGKPMASYVKQLVYVEKFTWDNKTAEREWANMTAEQRCAFAGIES